jgi:hypothetical protein
MSRPLKELRAQRELIQKHLNWLEAQIRDADGTDGVGHDESNLAEHPSETPAQTNDRVYQDIKTSVKPCSTADVDVEIGDKLMKYSGGVDIQRVKIGCFIFFAAITLLFLFLLFGLPYLLD